MEGVDYQELLLGIENQSTGDTRQIELSTVDVPLTIPDNVDVRQLRHDEEINKALYGVKLACLLVAQALFVDDHIPIPELFYVTQEKNAFASHHSRNHYHA
jgi:hypothetical protein